MTNIDLQAAEAERLRALGYAPIPVQGKIPHISGWQKLGTATAEDIKSWSAVHSTHLNTSILTATTPAFDIDLKDEDAATAVEHLVRDHFGESGHILTRVGMAPKRLVPFQTAKSYRKIVVNLINSAGQTGDKVELLCDGQQCVVHGIHPDTQRPYAWFGGELHDVERASLPHLNEAEARMLVQDAVELLVVEHGYTIAATRPKVGGNDHDEFRPAAEVFGNGEDWDYLIENILAGNALHDSTRDLAAKLAAAGMSDGAAVNLIRGVMAKSKVLRDDRFYDRYENIPNLVRSAAKKFANIEEPTFTITVQSGNLHEVVMQSEAALIKSNAPLYARGGEVVKPIVEEVAAFRGRRTKVPRLKVVNADCLRDHLSRVIRYQRYDGRTKEMVPTNPPHEVAATLLARDGDWKFPRLSGIITTPTLRPDGTILSEPGYDDSTGLLLVAALDMPAISERPSRDDAVAALELLDDLLVEFPFADPASRSVALSALMTPVARGAMSCVPLHAVAAPEAGTGKSFLIDIAACIATGEIAPVIAAGRTEEETEKRLAAELMTGQPIISIDNLNGDLAGDFICQAVERPTIKPRILGRSETKRIDNTVTIFGNGNNFRLAGDMVRRVVLCSLDANMERPELRQFRGDPITTILADRGRYVGAILTIVRAYLAAGCPDQCPSLASFGDWSRLVRSALVWLGRQDPVSTMEGARAEDPVRSALAEVFTAWCAVIGANNPLTAGEVKEKALSAMGADGGLLKAIGTVACAPGRTGVDAVRLGKWLGRNKGRVLGGYKLRGETDKHSKQVIWWLEPV